MSKEQEQSVNRKECNGVHSSSDEDQFEILEGGSKRLDSTTVLSTDDLRVNSDHDLEHHIADGLQVQAADVMIIDKMCYESNSIEGLKSTVLYEYSSDSDENHGSPLPEAYFDDAENLLSQKKSGASNYPIPPVCENERNKTQCDKSLDNCRLGNDVAGIPKPSLCSSGKQVQYLVPEMMYKAGRMIETDYTPMYEFNYIKPKTNRNKMPDNNCRQNLGYMECNSDEFADAEDNADSTAEERKFSSDASKPKSRFNGAYVVEKVDKESEDEDNSVSRKAGMEQTRNESVRSEVAGNDNSFPEPSTSYVPQPEFKPAKTFQDEAISQPSKNVRNETMNTIEEVPELEGDTENPNTPQLPVSKTNPLKAKSSVGSKKIRCGVCNARLGLCAFSCRCGGYYCPKHRYDREHNCTFDYRSIGAEEIRRNNPQVIAEKVRKL